MGWHEENRQRVQRKKQPKGNMVERNIDETLMSRTTVNINAQKNCGKERRMYTQN